MSRTELDAYMGDAHYSTTQRYLHHKPRPEHAQALYAAFGGDSERAARTMAWR